MDNQKEFSKTFTFTEPDAVNIAYIIQRNQDSPQYLEKLLAFAQSLDKAMK